ncbi:MAG: ATPase P [Desulfobacterales bacterium]
MIEIDIPGYRVLQLRHMVLDYNGTLAVDGRLAEGVREKLELLSRDLDIHVVTADTFGRVQSGMAGIAGTVTVLPVGNQAEAKLNHVRSLEARFTVAVGNGRNDRLMLKESALGVAVILGEGAAVETVMAGDVVCTSIGDALDMMLHPLRLTATLRS